MMVRAATWFKRPSLKLTVVMLMVLVLIPTMGVISIALFNAGNSLRGVSTEQLFQTANTIAHSASNELDILADLVLQVSEIERSHEAEGHASHFVRDKGFFEIHQARHEKGVWKAYGPEMDPVVMKLITDAANLGVVQVSDIQYSANSEKPLWIAVAVPEWTRLGETKILTLITTPYEIMRIFSRNVDNSNSLVMAITDSEGKIIGRADGNTQSIGKLVPNWEALKAVGGNSGTFRARSLEGTDYVFAFKLVPGTPGWAAVIGESAAAFDERWQKPIFMMIGASFLMILIGLVVAMWMTHHALRPIQHLAARARQIAAGTFPENSAIAATVEPSFIAEFEDLRVSLDDAEQVLRGSLEESRDAEYRARASTEALEQAERLAKLGHWELHLATGKMRLSNNLSDLFGNQKKGEAIEVSELQERVPPADFARLGAKIEHCIATGEPYALEVEHYRTDGTSFASYVRGAALRDESGKIVRLAGTVQDISERKEQQERLEALANNLPSGAIFRLERDPNQYFTISYLSAGLEPLLGMTVSEIKARPKLLVLAMRLEEAVSFHQELVKANINGDVLDRTFEIQTRAGESVWIHCRAYMRVYADGSAVWDGIARDVTAERKADAMLLEAKEAAESAERAKSDFLATMSHEIRTPMNSVIGMTRLALRTDLNAKQRNYLEKINESAGVLLHIINDILDFSKIEADGLVLERVPFELESVLETLSSVTALRAEEKGLEMAFHVAPDLAPVWKGDPLRLGQVLTNLVSNAIKFTDEGEVVVSISAMRNDQGKIEKILFSVRDTGIGLTQDQIKQIFTPFTQAQSDTSRKYGGTGLGLAICKRLVELMGGTIWVESEFGVGSTFLFTAKLEEAENTHKLPAVNRAMSNLLCNRRALIVDDNASAREVLTDMISAFGMQVSSVESGATALKMMESAADIGTPFDVVLLDWRMPDMDGIETARRIVSLKNSEQSPIMLMVTAYVQDVVMKAAKEIGLQGVLLKPVTQSVMFNTLLDALSLSSPKGESENRRASDSSVSLETFSQLGGKRVLVVDDNALNREVVSEFLYYVGVVVETAVNGRDAINKLSEQDFDAVLMDVHMPEMGGYEAVNEIRRHARWRDLPVIALTAQARDEDRRQSLEAGMTDHITKPIDEVTLMTTLTRLCVDPTFSSKPGSHPERAASTPQQTPQIDHLRRQRRLGGFLRDFKDGVVLFDTLLGKQDLEEVAAFTHQLKGAAAYLDSGAALSECAGKVEHAARHHDSETVASLAPQFRQLLNAILDEARHGIPDTAEAQPVNTMPVQEALALLSEAVKLVQSGDFNAKVLLEQLSVGLQGTQAAPMVRDGMDAFDDLELTTAIDILTRLRQSLESKVDQEHV